MRNRSGPSAGGTDEGSGAVAPTYRLVLSRIIFRDAMLAKFGEDVDIELALERNDQFEQSVWCYPLPSVEFRVPRRKVDVSIAPDETHGEPLLPLATITTAPPP